MDAVKGFEQISDIENQKAKEELFEFNLLNNQIEICGHDLNDFSNAVYWAQKHFNKEIEYSMNNGLHRQIEMLFQKGLTKKEINDFGEYKFTCLELMTDFFSYYFKQDILTDNFMFLVKKKKGFYFEAKRRGDRKGNKIFFKEEKPYMDILFDLIDLFQNMNLKSNEEIDFIFSEE